MRHRGGGHKRRIRTLDFDRKAPGAHLVERIEYDPNRSAHIALVRPVTSTGKTSDYSYILAAEGMRAGDTVQSFRAGIPDDLMASMGGRVDYGVLASKTAWRGNCLPLGMIPVGTQIYAIGLKSDGPAKYCRSAGTYGIVMGKGEDAVQKELGRISEEESGEDGKMRPVREMSQKRQEELRKLQKLSRLVTVKLNSGEVRNIPTDACATVGVASNANHQYAQLGKAGRNRWKGRRPTVRGVAMNAVDHPHGGGRGKGKGNRDPVSKWGKPVSLSHRISLFLFLSRKLNATPVCAEHADILFSTDQIGLQDPRQAQEGQANCDAQAEKPGQTEERVSIRGILQCMHIHVSISY